MKITTKRIDKSLPLPAYENGASCCDLVCRKNITIKPYEIKLVPLNSIIKVPEGYTLLIFMRSSTPLRKGLILANSVGVLDSFYCGDKDELVAEFLNITNKNVKVQKGEKLVQGMLVKHENIEWEETDKMKDKGIGGYKLDLKKEK